MLWGPTDSTRDPCDASMLNASGFLPITWVNVSSSDLGASFLAVMFVVDVACVGVDDDTRGAGELRDK